MLLFFLIFFSELNEPRKDLSSSPSSNSDHNTYYLFFIKSKVFIVHYSVYHIKKCANYTRGSHDNNSPPFSDHSPGNLFQPFPFHTLQACLSFSISISFFLLNKYQVPNQFTILLFFPSFPIFLLVFLIKVPPFL